MALVHYITCDNCKKKCEMIGLMGDKSNPGIYKRYEPFKLTREVFCQSDEASWFDNESFDFCSLNCIVEFINKRKEA
jgi:hypothetical protein